MHKGVSLALEALQHKTFAAEKTGPKFLGEGNGDLDAIGRTKIRIPLAKYGPLLPEIQRYDFTRVWCSKSDFVPLAASPLERGYKKRLSAKKPQPPEKRKLGVTFN